MRGIGQWASGPESWGKKSKKKPELVLSTLQEPVLPLSGTQIVLFYRSAKLCDRTYGSTVHIFAPGIRYPDRHVGYV